MSEKKHLPWKKWICLLFTKMDQKNCYLGTSHLLSHLIYACATEFLLCHFVSYLCYKYFQTLLYCLFIRRYLTKNCLVFQRTCLKHLFQYSHFPGFVFTSFSRDAPARLLLLSRLFLKLFWTTPAVVLCVLLPLLVSSSLIFVLYLSHAQLNYNRSVSHLDSHKHKFQTQTHLSGFFSRDGL